MKKWVKILAGITAFMLIGGLLWFANGLVGNPISKALAENAAEKYIGEHYPHMELEISDAFYNFKNGNYRVNVQSPTSIDTHFTVALSQTGRIQYDDYEDKVLGRWNTYYRISSSYRSKLEAIFDSSDFPYESEISFGELRFKEVTEDNESFGPIYGLVIEDLELDKDYDLVELGKEAGYVVFYTEDEDVSVKKAAEILLDIKNILDKENVPFYAIDFVLEKPRVEQEKQNPHDISVRVNEFLYSDIYEEGLEERIAGAAKALEEYYNEQDAKRAQFEATLGK